MEYKEGLVSVVIPTYKRADLLSRAVKSVLNQTYRQIECIVVNDNIPKDEYSLKLYELLKEFEEDERFVFLEQENHINGAAARNYGINFSHGEYIALLDDDDWWEVDKIEKQVEFIKKQSDSCGAVSTMVKFYKNGEVVRKSLPYRDGAIMFDVLSRRIEITTCSILIKRKCLEETGLFDVNLKRHQEVQLFTCLTEKYEIKLLKEFLTCVDISICENKPTSQNIRKIKKDFFESVTPQLNSLKKRDRRVVKLLHEQECALVDFREHNYKKAFASCLCILSSPRASYLSINRIMKRMKEKRI